MDALYQQEVVQRLTRIETHLEKIVGNGQPGILDRHAERIDALEKVNDMRGGQLSVFARVVAALWALLIFLAGLFGWHVRLKGGL